jgi:hypothetical protein
LLQVAFKRSTIQGLLKFKLFPLWGFRPSLQAVVVSGFFRKGFGTWSGTMFGVFLSEQIRLFWRKF